MSYFATYLRTLRHFIVSFISFCLFAFTGVLTTGAQGLDYSHNFIVETVVRVPGMTDTSVVNALGVDAAIRKVMYYDGLGRPLQSVDVGAVAGGSRDLVRHFEYDGYMRQSRHYLPYASHEQSSSKYRPDALSATMGFYASGASGHALEQYPYSETVYENSFLDRVLEQGSPGLAWQPSPERTVSTGHTVATEYGTCSVSGSDTVRVWKVDSGGIKSSGCYHPGHLLRVTTKGENWTIGRNGTVDVYTNSEEQVVLVRNWLSEEHSGDNFERALDTYYIYDRLGRLRYVLPPLLSEACSDSEFIADTTSAMLSYGYAYRYDVNGDCIWKRLPGQSPIIIHYDKNHRPVLYQDGNLRTRDEWRFTYYDALGRPAVSGECKWPNFTDVSETAFTAGYTGDSEVGGYNLSDRLPLGAKLLTINYYDDYKFLDIVPKECRDSLNASDLEHFGRGYLTGVSVCTLGSETSESLYTAFYYDDHGRSTRTRSMNHLSGYDSETIDYSFTGKPVRRTLIHSAANVPTSVEQYSYTYDNVDRLLSTTHSLDGGPAVQLSSVLYDYLGRVKTDSRNGSPFLSTSYSYNIRSWVTGIESELFSQTLYYDAPCYSGSVSSMDWRVGGDRLRGYEFHYDGLDRLVGADYRELQESVTTAKSLSHSDQSFLSTGSVAKVSHGRFSTSYGYDLHGNITSLSRKGLSGHETFTLGYDGNQQESVTPDSKTLRRLNASRARSDKFPETIVGYSFDANGNKTSDPFSGVVSASYTSFNLPSKVDLKSSDGSPHTIRFVYDALGRKLRTSFLESDGTTSVTDYVSNRVYENGILKYILIDGGYIEGGQYRFYLKDHLGSNRVVASADGNILQSVHYYPYGLPFGEGHSSSSQPYLFNGKEDLGGTGLTFLDYGARHFGTTLPVWMTPDPLAEKYYSISPYSYCNGNPLKFIDPDGREWRVTYREQEDGRKIPNGYEWVPHMYSYNEDGTLKEGLYKQAIFFSENGTFNKGKLKNMGSSTATVYLESGICLTFDACTYPSNADLYATVPEGVYHARVGKHRNKYDALRMSDIDNSGKIELGKPNPSDMRWTYAIGINIHRPGKNNITGNKNSQVISAGCLLIDIDRWNLFISLFNYPGQKNNIVSVTVSRTLQQPEDMNIISEYLFPLNVPMYIQ